MRKFIISALVGLLCISNAFAQQKTDTLRVSDLFTTHIIFNTDLIYADLSNSQAMAAKILEQSKNIMALKARSLFTAPLSVSALESNGEMRTFIVLYEKNPLNLVYDTREDYQEVIPQAADTTAVKKDARKEKSMKKKKGKNDSPAGAALYRKKNAPLLRDVVASDQELWHISTKQYDIEVTCTNILSYSDITYMVFKLKNDSGVSYDCNDATFVVESKKKSQKSVVYDKNLFPKSRFGTISCAPGKSSTIGYTLSKISLSKDQVLKVYFYEQEGQRELVLSIDPDDVNKAKNSL